MDELSKQYSPKETEGKWYKFWEENNLFAAKVNPAKEPFSIVIPPPNVTGILHMGHALNNTIQDILIRYHRMKGKETLWMPGTDHAGIATQNVVEKVIAKEGLRRQDLGREEFLERVWGWKEKYGSTIIHQLKKLGASCDWPRTRFTMDEGYSEAVKEAFVRLYQKGLIYRGNYIINWCPRCQTALSDEEAPHQDVEGFLYYIKYPVKKSTMSISPQTTAKKSESINYELSTMNYIVVATTRPETMPGDTAVAVNPKDRRYKKLIGKILILPLINRQIRIIADNMVDMKFGTGAVKVTPAHDPNDYRLGKKHNLEFVNIMYPDGRLNENAGDYKDMDRFQAREAILEDLREKGLLERAQPHKLSAGHCYRCNTIIEPYLSLQWFVKMEPLSKSAIDAVEGGRITFHPKRWRRVYLNWMENIRDWCISRQIWWGHRIPVYYCRNCQETGIQKPETRAEKPEIKDNVIVSRTKPERCPYCGSDDIYQDEDVLDTWFSSWLWPFATFGWPDQSSVVSRQLSDRNNLESENRKLKTELDYFYPTSVLVTAPEILFFWVARMIIAGLEFTGDIPFSDVYIHGTVRDIRGRKMSKSLGNVIDPLDIISEYGSDALRFCLASCTSQGDLFLSKEKFEMGRNFANKLWNASRFVLMNLKGGLPPQAAQPASSPANRWILSRLNRTIDSITRSLDAYRFNEAANTLYAFFWHDFCDWYLEIAKINLRDISTQEVMREVLEKSLRIMHPFMPFVTEEIWQRLTLGGHSIMIQSWPEVQEEIIDRRLESQMELIFDIIKSIRNLRSQLDLKPKQKVAVSLYPYKKNYYRLIKDSSGLIINLASLERLDFLDSSNGPGDTISDITKSANIYLHFAGLIDVKREKDRIRADILKKTRLLEAKDLRLKDKEFVKKAPSQIIQSEKEGIAELKKAIQRLERMYNQLSKRVTG
jgi:valyl-tRNA synthetase